VDHAAGLLPCIALVRGQSPKDYLVMVPAAPNALNGLARKSSEASGSRPQRQERVRLTRREEEVLDGILRSLANKGNRERIESFRAHREISCLFPARQIQGPRFASNSCERLSASFLELHSARRRWFGSAAASLSRSRAPRGLSQAGESEQGASARSPSHDGVATVVLHFVLVRKGPFRIKPERAFSFLSSL